MLCEVAIDEHFKATAFGLVKFVISGENIETCIFSLKDANMKTF